MPHCDTFRWKTKPNYEMTDIAKMGKNGNISEKIGNLSVDKLKTFDNVSSVQIW